MLYTTTYCPYCKTVLQFDIGVAASSPIGPPVAFCTQCNRPIRTKRREWPAMNTTQKVLYWIRVAWWWVGSVLFSTALLLIGLRLIFNPIGVSLSTVAAWVALSSSLLCAVVLVCGATREIRRSKRRWSDSQSGSTTWRSVY